MEVIWSSLMVKAELMLIDSNSQGFVLYSMTINFVQLINLGDIIKMELKQ